MIPFLSAGVTLASTKGFDLIANNSRTLQSKRKGKPSPLDNTLDAALTALAVAPQLVNVLGPSLLLERFYPMSLGTLYRIYKARPYLEGLSMAAIGALAIRQRLSQSDGRWLGRSLQAVSALRVSANFLSAPTAFAGQEDNHLVVTTRELNRLLKPESPVLGLFLNGEARCYPLEVIRKPHFIHDSVGGVPVVATYCDLTHTAIAFRDEWNGERLDLNVAGSPNGNVVFYEGRSDGLIQQLQAAIGAGPNKGDPLQTFPLVPCTWAQWRELHPQTSGIWYEGDVKNNAVKMMLEGIERLDARSREPFLAVRGGVDTRLPAKEEVLAVRIKGQSRAYTREYLKRHPVFNGELAGEPIVVLYDEQRDMAACFSRRLDGQLLTFTPAPHGKGLVEDQETGALWDITGCPRSGEGSCLKPVPLSADRVRWYGWAHFYPDTVVAGGQRTSEAARR